jgi:hypothetical protein
MRQFLKDPDNMGFVWLAVIVTVFAFLIYWEAGQNTPERQAESDLRLKCISKASGSQPECWDEKDWQVFCQKTGICRGTK